MRITLAMKSNVIDITERLKPFSLADPVQRDKHRIKTEIDRLHSKSRYPLTNGDELFSYAQRVYKDERFIFYTQETRCELVLFAHKYAQKLVRGNQDLDAYIAQMNMDG
jgi:hypothetical protein